jgi:hypothetical protein
MVPLAKLALPDDFTVRPFRANFERRGYSAACRGSIGSHARVPSRRAEITSMDGIPEAPSARFYDPALDEIGEAIRRFIEAPLAEARGWTGDEMVWSASGGWTTPS